MVAAKIANFCQREGLQSVFKGLKSIISNCNGAFPPSATTIADVCDEAVRMGFDM
jgi:hypothetical protein